MRVVELPVRLVRRRSQMHARYGGKLPERYSRYGSQCKSASINRINSERNRYRSEIELIIWAFDACVNLENHDSITCERY